MPTLEYKQFHANRNIWKNDIFQHCLEGSPLKYFCLSDIKISDFVDRGQLDKLNPLKPIKFFFHLATMLMEQIFRVFTQINFGSFKLKHTFERASRCNIRQFSHFQYKGCNVLITPTKLNLNTWHKKHRYFTHRKMTTHLTTKSLVNITKLFCQDITDFTEFINE